MAALRKGNGDRFHNAIPVHNMKPAVMGVAPPGATKSYCYAPASVVAPFGYVSLLWAFFFGCAYAGATVVMGCGPLMIRRERSPGTKDKPRKI